MIEQPAISGRHSRLEQRSSCVATISLLLTERPKRPAGCWELTAWRNWIESSQANQQNDRLDLKRVAITFCEIAGGRKRITCSLIAVIMVQTIAVTHTPTRCRLSWR